MSHAALHHRRRPGRATVTIVIVLVTFLTMGIARAGTSLAIAAPLDRPDVIVSLASHEWERLPVTARLALKYPDAQIVLTQPPAASRRNCYQCPQRVDYLLRLGVARDRVHVVKLSESSTYGEALATRGFVAQSGRHRVLIVTSAYHARRALATFQHVFGSDQVTVGLEPADPSTWARPRLWWTRPYDRWYVTYEWAAAISYRIRHDVPISSLAHR